MKRLPSALLQPKVLALILVGLVMFAASWLLPQTPTHHLRLQGKLVPYHETHPIDVIGAAVRLVGAVSLVVGLIAAVAYARGEMEAPTDVAPSESHTKDDDLTSYAPWGLSG